MRPLVSLLAFSALLATGCIPIKERFLRPSAPGIEHHRSICAGWVGVHDRAVMLASRGVMLGVEVYPVAPTGAGGEALGVTMIVYLPKAPDLEVRFASRSFVLTDGAGVTHEVFASEAFEMHDTRVLVDGLAATRVVRTGPFSVRAFDLLEPMRGTGRDRWHGSPPVWFGRKLEQQPYYVVVSFPGVAPGPARLLLPPLYIAEEAFQAPELEIREASEWYVAPMNC